MTKGSRNTAHSNDPWQSNSFDADFAAAYVHWALPFAAIRRARDRIVHGAQDPPTIFVTERGLGVQADSVHLPG